MVAAKVVKNCSTVRRSLRLQGKKPEYYFLRGFQSKRSFRKLTDRRKQKIREFLKNSHRYGTALTKPWIAHLIEFMQEPSWTKVIAEDVIEWMKDSEFRNLVPSASPTASTSASGNGAGKGKDTDTVEKSGSILSKQPGPSQNATNSEDDTHLPERQTEEEGNTEALSPTIPSDVPQDHDAATDTSMEGQQHPQVTSTAEEDLIVQDHSNFSFPFDVASLPIPVIMDLCNQCQEMLQTAGVIKIEYLDVNTQDEEDSAKRPVTLEFLVKEISELKRTMTEFIVKFSSSN